MRRRRGSSRNRAEWSSEFPAALSLPMAAGFCWATRRVRRDGTFRRDWLSPASHSPPLRCANCRRRQVSSRARRNSAPSERMPTCATRISHCLPGRRQRSRRRKRSRVAPLLRCPTARFCRSSIGSVGSNGTQRWARLARTLPACWVLFGRFSRIRAGPRRCCVRQPEAARRQQGVRVPQLSDAVRCDLQLRRCDDCSRGSRRQHDRPGRSHRRHNCRRRWCNVRRLIARRCVDHSRSDLRRIGGRRRRRPHIGCCSGLRNTSSHGQQGDGGQNGVTHERFLFSN